METCLKIAYSSNELKVKNVHIPARGFVHSSAFSFACFHTRIPLYERGRISCVEHVTDGPVTQAGVPDAARDVSPGVFQCRLSYNVCTALVCSHMHQHLYAR